MPAAATMPRRHEKNAEAEAAGTTATRKATATGTEATGVDEVEDAGIDLPEHQGLKDESHH